MTVLSPPAADDAKVRIALFAPLNDDDDDEDLIFGSNAREINDRAENMVFFVFVFVCLCLFVAFDAAVGIAASVFISGDWITCPIIFSKYPS